MLIRMAIMAVIILTGCDRSQPADASNSEQKIGDSVALNSEALRQTKLSNTVFDFDFSNKGENLKLLFEAIYKANVQGDSKTAAALSRTLIPNKKELKIALNDSVDDNTLNSIIEFHKSFISNITNDSEMARFFINNLSQSEVLVHDATTEAIAEGSGQGNEFPGGAKEIAATILKKGLTFYVVDLVKPGEDLGMRYDLFFWAGDHWCFLGKIWRVIEPMNNQTSTSEIFTKDPGIVQSVKYGLSAEAREVAALIDKKGYDAAYILLKNYYHSRPSDAGLYCQYVRLLIASMDIVENPYIESFLKTDDKYNRLFITNYAASIAVQMDSQAKPYVADIIFRELYALLEHRASNNEGYILGYDSLFNHNAKNIWFSAPANQIYLAWFAMEYDREVAKKWAAKYESLIPVFVRNGKASSAMWTGNLVGEMKAGPQMDEDFILATKYFLAAAQTGKCLLEVVNDASAIYTEILAEKCKNAALKKDERYAELLKAIDQHGGDIDIYRRKSLLPENLLLSYQVCLANGVHIKMVYVPAGAYEMGSPENELGRSSDEGPVHAVKISRGFYIGAHEVTQEQYEAVVGDNPSKFKGKNNPVDQVSWEDAMAFCKQLSQNEGKTYRLPTEAEWEYACRAGNTTAYYFGNNSNQLGEYAWYNGNSGNETHPVGQKKSNAFGLYDMHGNVWEMCLDWYGGDYYLNSPQCDPKGMDVGVTRVVRGGSWFNQPNYCRSAVRHIIRPDRRVDCGFRIVMQP